MRAFIKWKDHLWLEIALLLPQASTCTHRQVFVS